MFIHCSLALLMLAMTLQSQAYVVKAIVGYEAKPHSRPYMVLVERIMENNDIKYCGGFLIRDDFVMTAANCQAKSHKVFLGLHKYTGNYEKGSVKRAFLHENYNEQYYLNDIMLLKLSEKAEITKNVQPIALADKEDSSLPNSCTVSGWGKTSENSLLSDTLMEASVTLVDNELCVKENVYCSKGGIGPMQGDAGGPLVCEDGKAYGVVSAIHKTEGSILYRYTKIPDSIDWITYIIHNWGCSVLLPCSKKGSVPSPGSFCMEFECSP
ncbi:granzyme G-like [Cyprinodon tularosa]|uniref:granzyme G-like n=1 Tax=Cyprinodon tularosa TaxID=77115 RepID=UPI0018E2762E|nr:granzyme G-like [Cyprinodon tularosa]